MPLQQKEKYCLLALAKFLMRSVKVDYRKPFDKSIKIKFLIKCLRFYQSIDMVDVDTHKHWFYHPLQVVCLFNASK